MSQIDQFSFIITAIAVEVSAVATLFSLYSDSVSYLGQATKALCCANLESMDPVFSSDQSLFLKKRVKISASGEVTDTMN